MRTKYMNHVTQLVNKYMYCVNTIYVVSTDTKPNSRLWHKFFPEVTLLSVASTRDLLSDTWSNKVALTIHSLPTSISKEESSTGTAVAGLFLPEESHFVQCFSHGMHLGLDGNIARFSSVLCNFHGILFDLQCKELKFTIRPWFWQTRVFGTILLSAKAHLQVGRAALIRSFLALISIPLYLAWVRGQDELRLLNGIL